jgi:arylsulfatase A-like enzyme
MIVLTSDHGENSRASWEHGHALYDESLKVPLIVKFPGAAFRGKRVGGFVRLVDVMPTILEAFDIGTDGLGLDGRGLFDVLRGRDQGDRAVLAIRRRRLLPPFREEHLTDGRTNHPQQALQPGRGRILPVPAARRAGSKLTTWRRPGERTDIAARRAGDAARLVAVMRELAGRGRKPGGPKTEIDAETKEKLRALGYIR